MSPVISRIEKEFIYKFLVVNKIELDIQCKNRHTQGYLLDHNSKELKIEIFNLFNELYSPNAEINVIFYFKNNYHTFKTNIIKIQGNTAIIHNPENIAKNLQRKFERIIVDGKLQAKFTIKGDLIRLNYPETIVHYYPNKPPIEADLYDVKIENLINKFRNKLSNIVSYNKIKMLRNYTPITFEEQLVVKYGKILYIPSVYSDLPQKQLSHDSEILLKNEWVKFEILKNKTQPYLTNKALSDYLKKEANHGIYSKAIIPILYRNYVVGLIYLINDERRTTPISVKVIDYCYDFSRLLSYALKENGYFKEEEKNTQRYIVPIYDLSGGGLAFKNDNNFFEDKLLLNHNVYFMLEIEKHKIRILTKLIRKFKEKDFYFYGFIFLDIKQEDHEFLNKYLYTNY